MNNLNEEINRFKELLSAQHGVIKPFKTTNNRYGLFNEQAPETAGDTSSQTKLPPLPPAETPAPPTGQENLPPLPPPETPEPPANTPMETPKPPNQPTESEFNEEEDEYEDYSEDGWDVGETNLFDEMLQDAIDEARDVLEYECGYTDDEVNKLNEMDYVEELFANGYVELANQIKELFFQTSADMNEPYDSIGGHSPKDLDDAFNKMMKKNK